MTTKQATEKEGRRHNIGFAKWRVKCFYDSLVQGSNSVFQLKFCAENPPLRKAENRQAVKKTSFLPNHQLSQSNSFDLSQAKFCCVWVSVKNI